MTKNELIIVSNNELIFFDMNKMKFLIYHDKVSDYNDLSKRLVVIRIFKYYLNCWFFLRKVVYLLFSKWQINHLA